MLQIEGHLMKIAYLDCLAGASGAMILGALVDAGLPLVSLRERLSSLDLDEEFELKGEKVSRNGVVATRVDVITDASHPSDRKENLNGRLIGFETILRNVPTPGRGGGGHPGAPGGTSTFA
jgi:uncharacterized protein (DUF111 family)